VLGVDSPQTAEKIVDAVVQLPDPHSCAVLTDAAWVERRPDGTVRIHQAYSAVVPGAVAGMGTGALLGGLVGLLFLNPVAEPQIIHRHRSMQCGYSHLIAQHRCVAETWQKEAASGSCGGAQVAQSGCSLRYSWTS
jgi:hypothetical protein